MLAQGKRQLAAQKQAGFAKSSKNALILSRQPHIVERVRELQELAVVDTTLTIQKVIAELEKIAFSNMMDFIKVENGQPVLEFSRMTRDQAAAIGEITTDEITSPRDGSITRRTKFKLLDKKGSLVDLGRYLGMFIDRKDIRVGGVMFHITGDDANL